MWQGISKSQRMVFLFVPIPAYSCRIGQNKGIRHVGPFHGWCTDSSIKPGNPFKKPDDTDWFHTLELVI